MALFLGIHEMGHPVTEDQMEGIWEAYKASCNKIGCTAMRVHVNHEQGRAFCLTEASSADEVVKAHEESEKPSSTPEIVEVQILE